MLTPSQQVLAPLLNNLTTLQLASNYLDGTTLDASLCPVACSAAASGQAFACPTPALSGCPAPCAAATAQSACQPVCTVPGVSTASWGASIQTPCSTTLSACTICMPAIQAPLVAAGTGLGSPDDRVCISQNMATFLTLGVSVSVLGALTNCAPQCIVTAAPDFTAANAFCGLSTTSTCACFAAIAGPFLAGGVGDAFTLTNCLQQYTGALAVETSIPSVNSFGNCSTASFFNVTSPPQKASSGLTRQQRDGAIAGAVVGGVLLLALLFAALLRWHHSRLASAAAAASHGSAAGWQAVLADESEVQLGKLLGTGGHASVYEARWRGSAVAVKVFPSNFFGTARTSTGGSSQAAVFVASSTQSLVPLDAVLADLRFGNPSASATSPVSETSFLREVKLLSSLRHPHIVAIYATVLEPRRMLIMELGAAGSLWQLLGTSSLAKLSWASRIRLGTGVAAGVAFLHAQEPQIIHLDLKSANVVLDRALVPKVGDFGISAVGGVGAGRARGTPAFMAPEVARQQVITNFPAVDAWGVGIILLDLVHTGTSEDPEAALALAELPKGDTMATLLAREQQNYATEIQPHVPESLARITLACLSVDPGKRPVVQAVQDMLTEASKSERFGGGARASFEFPRRPEPKTHVS